MVNGWVSKDLLPRDRCCSSVVMFPPFLDVFQHLCMWWKWLIHGNSWCFFISCRLGRYVNSPFVSHLAPSFSGSLQHPMLLMCSNSEFLGLRWIGFVDGASWGVGFLNVFVSVQHGVVLVNGEHRFELLHKDLRFWFPDVDKDSVNFRRTNPMVPWIWCLSEWFVVVIYFRHSFLSCFLHSL